MRHPANLTEEGLDTMRAIVARNARSCEQIREDCVANFLIWDPDIIEAAVRSLDFTLGEDGLDLKVVDPNYRRYAICAARGLFSLIDAEIDGFCLSMA